MKNFNLNLTILLILSGCGSIETHTTIESEEELNQVEQNTTLSREETNHSQIETIETQDSEPEQNHTTEITQPIDITPSTSNITTTNEIEEIEEITPIVEKELDYTKEFISKENCHQILDKEFLTICYDYNLKAAKGVAYTLYGDLVNELNIQDRPSFHIEEDIESIYRATISDYTNRGYDRGHLAPDASFDWSQESLDSTYSLANIIPQVPKVNRQMWVKAENYARAKAVELFELNILNLVKYSDSPQQIGENNISVSIGYYKILFNIDEKYEECFYYANDFNASAENDQLKNHTINCANI
jgi:endonuclease G